MINNNKQTDESAAQLSGFAEEWYEDSIDLDLHAYRLTEDEWLEQEKYSLLSKRPEER